MHYPGTDNWEKYKVECYTLKWRGRRLALQLTSESHSKKNQTRVILFGKELLGSRKSSGNTARLTFNSMNLNEGGYFLDPVLKPIHRKALRFVMGNRSSYPQLN